MKKVAKIVATAAACGFVASAVYQGTDYAGSLIFGTAAVQEEDSGTGQIQMPEAAAVGSVSTANNGGGNSNVADTVEQVLPSIVSIDVTATVTSNTFFGPQTRQSAGSGSGIIIADKNDKLYIATNNHVVDGADTVTIKFCNDKEAEASVKGTDESNDLAVVEVAKKDLSEDTLGAIKTAVIGDSSSTRVGEQAIAIGNALGYGTSVTVGYISAKDRDINSVSLMQTDAAINPGNSGGALVNDQGEVIGINSSKFASEEIEGVGFAIPMERAQPILTKLMDSSADTGSGSADSSDGSATNGGQDSQDGSGIYGGRDS